jgi:DNA-binding MarR family transcriptional regulator
MNRPSARVQTVPDAEVRDILDALRRVVRALRVSASSAEKRVGLSGAQLFVLQRLAQRPALSLAELASLTLTDPSSVSVVTARLVDAGLVERKASPRDARRAELSLTAAGRALLRRAPDPAQEALIAAVGRLPVAERRALGRGLARIAQEMGVDGGAPVMFFEEEPRAGRARKGAASAQERKATRAAAAGDKRKAVRKGARAESEARRG